MRSRINIGTAPNRRKRSENNSEKINDQDEKVVKMKISDAKMMQLILIVQGFFDSEERL